MLLFPVIMIDYRSIYLNYVLALDTWVDYVACKICDYIDVLWRRCPYGLISLFFKCCDVLNDSPY